MSSQRQKAYNLIVDQFRLNQSLECAQKHSGGHRQADYKQNDLLEMISKVSIWQEEYERQATLRTTIYRPLRLLERSKAVADAKRSPSSDVNTGNPLKGGDVECLVNIITPHLIRHNRQLAEIEELSKTKIDQPQYSPDITPRDYCLFRSMDHFLHGRRFTEDRKDKATLI
ncbi:hypothetical protein ABEB36_007151 [Hypothenemus hampei]|uniref:Uncharacterized protein n=1 Tax=Hypothenemus hampei TaxID=57062 RepID=A0ABD1ESY6_HYPHA